VLRGVLNTHLVPVLLARAPLLVRTAAAAQSVAAASQAAGWRAVWGVRGLVDAPRGSSARCAAARVPLARVWTTGCRAAPAAVPLLP
jgi:hypothetical protein